MGLDGASWALTRRVAAGGGQEAGGQVGGGVAVWGAFALGSHALQGLVQTFLARHLLPRSHLLPMPLCTCMQGVAAGGAPGVPAAVSCCHPTWRAGAVRCAGQ